MAKTTAKATLNCFLPTPQNSHALWFFFISLTLFLMGFAVARGGLGWSRVDTVILPFAAAWLFLFGRVFQIQFAIELPAGITLSNEDADPDDASDGYD